MLAYRATHVTDRKAFRLHPRDVVRRLGIGRDRFYAILRKLQALGYVKREQGRDGRGQDFAKATEIVHLRRGRTGWAQRLSKSSSDPCSTSAFQPSPSACCSTCVRTPKLSACGSLRSLIVLVGKRTLWSGTLRRCARRACCPRAAIGNRKSRKRRNRKRKSRRRKSRDAKAGRACKGRRTKGDGGDFHLPTLPPRLQLPLRLVLTLRLHQTGRAVALKET